MKSFYLIVLSLIFSCSVTDDFYRKEFVYHNQDKQKKLIVQVPKGYKDENRLLDTAGGKEQFYYYGNGALLYLTSNVSWQTENEIFISKMAFSKTKPGKYSFNGIDSVGLYWKEIRHEDFRFGYSYVPASMLGMFEQALNSIRIR